MRIPIPNAHRFHDDSTTDSIKVQACGRQFPRSRECSHFSRRICRIHAMTCPGAGTTMDGKRWLCLAADIAIVTACYLDGL